MGEIGDLGGLLAGLGEWRTEACIELCRRGGECANGERGEMTTRKSAQKSARAGGERGHCGRMTLCGQLGRGS